MRSTSLAAGADLKVVQAMLRHSSIAITADTYTTVLPEVLTVVDLVDDAVVGVADDRGVRRPGAVALGEGSPSGRLCGVRSERAARPSMPPRSAFAGFRFPPDVIVLAVRWYLRFGLSYRDAKELPPNAVSRWTT